MDRWPLVVGLAVAWTLNNGGLTPISKTPLPAFFCLSPLPFPFPCPSPCSCLWPQAQNAQLKRDAEIWEMLSRFAAETGASAPPKGGGAPGSLPARLPASSAAQAPGAPRALLSAPPPRSVASSARAAQLPSSLAAAPGSHLQVQVCPSCEYVNAFPYWVIKA